MNFRVYTTEVKRYYLQDRLKQTPIPILSGNIYPCSHQVRDILKPVSNLNRLELITVLNKHIEDEIRMPMHNCLIIIMGEKM